MKTGVVGRHRLKGALALAAFMLLVCGLMAGCSAQQDDRQPNAQQENQAPSLSGQTLSIYCGAGMTKPFTEISDLFAEETGCEMNVTYANAAQIQTQINTTGEGDMFIAGSKEEVKPVENAVDTSIDLVKHIPVLAVPDANPARIESLADLAGAQTVMVGDPEATPIGKIARKALGDAGVWESLMNSGVITTTTTAPQIATALANGEGDAGIVWKENADVDGVSIVETSDLDNMVKVIPCAVLKSAGDNEAVSEFEEFLQSDAVWDIWAKYGYERA